jgi:ribosomal protein S18 acetylase RimI-like enzyme
MVTVRSARESDSRALAAVDQETWSPQVSPAPRPAPGSPFADRDRLRDIIVAEVDGEVAGYVALTQTIPLASHSHVLEINGLAVSPRRQGAGVGRRLIEEAKTEAEKRGASKLTLRVLAPNTGARALYEACGFRVEGVLEGEFLLEGRATDDVLMACHLDGHRT